MNLLVDEGILYKRRGVGLFVKAGGARQKIFVKRKAQFYELFVATLLEEAKKLDISREELIAMIERGCIQWGKLEILGLTKKYGETVALDQVDLVLEEDKIYGLLGRNGAGKTTLLNLLTAKLFPTSGKITVGGEAVWENEKALGRIFTWLKKIFILAICGSGTSLNGRVSFIRLLTEDTL